jgi:uncharacterized SAM-dependent methyltransferase
MHLVSMCSQSVRVGGHIYDFAEGETLHTENSYKFTAPAIQQLASEAGLREGPYWMDQNNWFGLFWFDIPTQT